MRDTFTNTEADAAAFERAYRIGTHAADYGDIWEDAYEAEPPLACLACGGPLVPLGTLGRLDWFRCRDCGMDQEQHEAEVARDQDTDAMIADCFEQYQGYDVSDDTETTGLNPF